MLPLANHFGVRSIAWLDGLLAMYNAQDATIAPADICLGDSSLGRALATIR